MTTSKQRGAARRRKAPDPGAPEAGRVAVALSQPAASEPGGSAQALAAPLPADLAAEVSRLAARGLSEPEIRARMNGLEGLTECAEEALRSAFQRGRLLGRAHIKEAQFEAALAGRVTAQSAVLGRLGEPDGGGEEEGTIDDPSAEEGAAHDGLGQTGRQTWGGPARPQVERRILGGGPQGGAPD